MSDAERLGQRMRGLRGEARLKAIGEVVSRWRASGRSQAAFCSEIGIATVTLGRWLRRLEAARAPRDPGEPVLVEIGKAQRDGEGAFEVVLPAGTRVRVPVDFRAGDLSRLLGVLSSAC
jgi:hypothetical protein